MPGTETQGQPRDPDTIQREIEERREDLAVSLSELGTEVRDKLDVKKRAREAVARGKEKARYGVDRGRLMVRSHLDITGAVLGGLLALLAVRIARRRRR